MKGRVNYIGYNQELPEYGFGDWLGRNAGTIGTVVGAGIGTLIAPGIGTSIGASLGGSVGGAVQKGHEGNKAADALELKMQQQERQQNEQANLMMAQNQLKQSQTNSEFAGTNSFAYGGNLGDGDKRLFRRQQDYLNKVIPENVLNAVYMTLPHDRDRLRNITGINADSGTIRNINRAISPLGDTDLQRAKSYSLSQGDNIGKRGIGTLTFPGKQRQFAKIRSPHSFSGEDVQRVYDLIDAEKSRQTGLNTSLSNIAQQNNIQTPQITFANGGLLEGITQGTQDAQLNEFKGQSHQGPDGGIKVDAQGNPIEVSGQQPVGKVENKENSWTDPETGQVYIFSDKLFLD